MDKDINRPRVLVTTVSGWSNSIGSDTMSTLFSRYDSSKLASLYIRAELSDSPVCNRYFHIFENRIIKSLFRKHVVTGEEFITTGNEKAIITSAYKKEKAFYSKFIKFRPRILILIRELIWKFGHWKSKELNDFLDDFKPEVVFFPIESYIHLNRINEYIIKRCKPRLVICNLWDDNFTYKQSKSIGYKIHRFWLRKHYRKLVNLGDVFIAQNPKMQREFKEEFGKDTVLITKPIFHIGEFKEYTPKSPIKLLYTGSLYINRDKSIIALANAIKKINSNGIKVELDVYSGTSISSAQRNAIECDPGCHFKGHINQSEVFKLQQEADILVFVEDLSDKNLAARLSFSTKITDYLRAGKCILAIGNKDLAPMEYLLEQNAACVCTDAKEIYPALKELVEDKKKIVLYAKNAYDCGRNYHDGDVLLEKLYSIICER